MGKKKHKGHKHDGAKSGGHKHGHRDAADAPFVVPPALAGIAAAALKQVNTPAFQQMVAGALGAAAQAFDPKREARPTRPEPPQPFVAPVVDQPPADAPGIKLSPDAQQAIDQVAAQAGKAIEAAAAVASQAIGAASAALERWAEKQAQARSHGEPPIDMPPP